MVARLVTVLVLLVAIGSVSWGMRANAQNDTLEDRVSLMEQKMLAMQGTVQDLLFRSLPPKAPRQDDNAVLGFFTIDPNYSFQISCNINTYSLGTQYLLECMRFEP